MLYPGILFSFKATHIRVRHADSGTRIQSERHRDHFGAVVGPIQVLLPNEQWYALDVSPIPEVPLACDASSRSLWRRKVRFAPSQELPVCVAMWSGMRCRWGDALLFRA